MTTCQHQFNMLVDDTTPIALCQSPIFVKSSRPHPTNNWPAPSWKENAGRHRLVVVVLDYELISQDNQSQA